MGGEVRGDFATPTQLLGVPSMVQVASGRRVRLIAADDMIWARELLVVMTLETKPRVHNVAC